jgi:ribulose-phosphate 3-epimerase
MAASQISITASILSADLGRLQEEVADVEKAGADGIQIDVMDGHFVPNLTFGTPVIRCLKTRLPLDIHLMVSNPQAHIDEFAKLGVKNITFHAEAVDEPQAQQALVREIRQSGASCGIAIKPRTPLSAISHLLAKGGVGGGVDLVLVMSVEPGFAGQEFQVSVLEKIRDIRRAHPDLPIQVDGGINPETARLCREAGATNLVAATAIFGKKDRRKAIEDLRG